MIGVALRRSIMLAGAIALACAAWFGPRLAAHVTVVSQYTFYKDVLPILENRCGSCHVESGVAASLLLLTYEGARQRSWPIRQSLISGRMPPWYAEGVPVPFKDAPTLTAKEFNILMVWAAGGTPEGKPVAAHPAASSRSQAPDTAPAGIRTITLTGIGEFPFGTDRTFSVNAGRAMRLVALRPVSGPVDATVHLTIVSPSGNRTPLAILTLRKDWGRRYVFTSPIHVERNARIEARVTPSAGVIWGSLTGDAPIGPTEGGALKLIVEGMD